MQREKIIVKLQQQITEIKSFGVKSLAIFGSVARDEARPESDLDLLVEFEGKVSFDQYMDLNLRFVALF